MILKKYLNKLKKSANISSGTRKSDEKFLEDIYQKLLGRKIDETGKSVQLNFLREGNSRISLILNIIESEEFINKVIRENIPLVPITNERSDNYHLINDIFGKERMWVFKVENMDDFDWLEKRIIENGYYERPGAWSFDINEDKILLADMISQFHPQYVLDIGCASGPIIKCLTERGIHCDGVEISQMAITKAFPEIRENIHFGNILDIELSSCYDMILGLDIFEHLNPNKLEGCISKIYNLLLEEGYLFCNIPAFGNDLVFGEIFQIYIKDWEEDIRKKGFFQTVHVDSYGYPFNGHIIGADSEWWVKQFESAGFKREIEIERALHKKYDDAMDRISVARKSYYIFSKNRNDNKNQDIIKNLMR